MGFNATLFEVMLYPESFDFGSLDDILQEKSSSIRNYAYILHDKDEGKKHHVHLMLRTWHSWNSDQIAKWFGVNNNQLEKCKGRFADMLAYLTHANAPGKHQYSPDSVRSNFDWQDEAKKAGNGKGRLDEIVELIKTGEIRQYNYTDFVDVHERVKFKRAMDIAFEWRRHELRRRDRDMECIFVTGKSGVGKTTFAKDLADLRGLRAYVSSSSNDSLGDYQGEDCIILDDLRPESISLADLLKLLDNHTESTFKSRYYNKYLSECKLIIITTTLPIEQFFENVQNIGEEDIVQLKRRCRVYVRMTKESVFSRMYLEPIRDYGKAIETPNQVLKKYDLVHMTPEGQIEFLANSLGVASDALKTMLKNKDQFLGLSKQEKLMDDIKDVLGAKEII